jgi:hypothetical protein
MKTKVLVFLFVQCTLVAHGQFMSYSKSELTGSTFEDIRLVGFKDNEHGKKVLNAISATGHLKDAKERGPNSYYITNEGDFVVQTTKKVGLLFNDTYVLLYRPKYLENAVVLEFYRLKFKAWDQAAATDGRSASKPGVVVKPVQKLTDEVKELAKLYASNENELQRVLNEYNQIQASINKQVEEEVKAKEERYTDLKLVFSGFKDEEFAFEVLKESVKDFNNKSADRNGHGIGASLTEVVNWKKIKDIEFFVDPNTPYKGKLFACAVGTKGAVQSGYIIFNAVYNSDSNNLTITRLEMLKVPGIAKRYYERSKFEQFKSGSGLGLTLDDDYQKNGIYILDELKNIVNKNKNSPEFSSYLLAQKKETNRVRAEEQKINAANREERQKIVEANRKLKEVQLKTANKDMLSLEEGDKVCYNYFNYSYYSDMTSDILAYVEKYNSSKTKVQLRVHQVSNSPANNMYEGISFSKGDLIWISLPMTNEFKYWARCQ